MHNQKQKILALIAGTLSIAMVLLSTVTHLYAATTTPATINYQGRLLSSANVPLSGAYTFRFSLWTSTDWVAGDTTGAGAINAGAGTYAGWFETHAVTTGTFGLFNMALGSTTTLPNFDGNIHKYLQVEVKPSASPDTSYEILDPLGTLADTTDRKTISKEAFAENADTLDNAELGTAAGDIALLGAGGVWSTSQIPNGTDEDDFIIDSDDSVAGDINLQFGATLAKILKYSQANSWFDFNDDVNIQGNLTLTGTVDGVDISNFQFTDIGTRVKKAVFTPEYDGSSIEADGATNRGKMILDFIDSGGTNKRNFYEWTTRQTPIQDMDVVLSFQLPLDFAGFTGSPLSINYQTSNAVTTTNKVDAALYDTTGTVVPLTGASTLASGSWTTANITFGGSPTFTAGSTITLRLKLSSTNSGWARLSDVVFNYNGR